MKAQDSDELFLVLFLLSGSMLGNLSSGLRFALYKPGLDTFKVTVLPGSQF